MARCIRVLWAILGAVGCVGAAASSAAEKMPPTDLLASDARLQRRVTVTAPGRSVDVLLHRLSAEIGVPLSAEQACGDQKLILVSKSGTAAQALQLIATHFDYRWKRTEAASEGAPYSYRLTQSPVRAALAERMRREAEDAKTARVYRRLELAIRALDATPEVREQIRREDKQIISLVDTGDSIRNRIRLAATLTEAERRHIAAGGRVVSPPLGALNPAIRELAITTGGLNRGGRDPNVMRMVFERQNEDGADAILFSVIGEDQRPVRGGGGVTYGASPRREASIPLGPYATDPALNPRDVALNRTALLVDAKGEPVELRAGVPALLESISRASGLNILSDHYSGQSPRFDVEALGQRPLWQLLNIITLQYGLEWTRRSTFLLLRHREWFEVEAEEIPERLLDGWRSAQEPAPRVGAKEALDTVSALTPAQLGGLRFQFKGIHLDPPYRWERFLGTLEGRQRQQLLDNVPIAGAELREESRTLFAEMMGITPKQVADDPSARILLARTATQLRGTLTFRSEARDHVINLPLKERPLPDPVVSVSPAPK